MNLITVNIENLIINLNFFLLFLTTLVYWLKSSLFLSPKFYFLPNIGIFFSTIFQASFLCLRWIVSGHFPVSNLYESLLFLSWVLTSLLVYFNFKLNNPVDGLINKKNLIASKNSNQTLFDSLLGSLITPLILLLNTFASFSLPNELKISTALVPALQSNWLLMHVTVMLLSYAALLCGCLFSIAYLILTFFSEYKYVKHMSFETNHLNYLLTDEKNNLNETQLLVSMEQQISNSFNETTKQSNLVKQNIPTKNFSELLQNLDNLSYRILGLGFPLLTIGLLSGAVWANQTWGSYWSWDPKETWALITWFIFAIYLHTRLSKGWSGKKSAFLASFGFFIIWICYLGVNLMGKGLHSYGFFN